MVFKMPPFPVQQFDNLMTKQPVSAKPKKDRRKNKLKEKDNPKPKKRKKESPLPTSSPALTLAEKADKFVCYQKSVQAPDHEVDFFTRAYRDCFRRVPYSLREDFCGTFSVCCRWVASNKKRTAIGVDYCAQTLQWGKENNLTELDQDQQKRIRLIQQDVRKRNRPQVDVLAAQNFSFWIFKTRAEVVEYFKIARANLKREGIMVMDMMGGGECYTEGHKDKRTIKKGKKGFKYHWTQVSFNPINHDAEFNISFKFADGSWLKEAFVYRWRFWTIPEVREMLAEAGFSESYVYWDQEEDEDKDSVWKRDEVAASDPSWISYVVAKR